MARRIGELLVKRGVVSDADIDLARESAAASGSRLASQIVSLGLAEEGPVIDALASVAGCPAVDLSCCAIALDVLSLIPREVAEQEHILPLKADGDRLLLAMADPHDARVIEEVQLISGLTVLPHVALATRLAEVLAAAYSALGKGLTLWVGEGLPGTTSEPVLAVRTAATAVPLEPAVAVGGDIAIDDTFDVDVEELGSVSARQGPRVVLAVDDEEQILTLVAKTLEKQGIKVECARRGQEALDRVAELMPDLVLLDANIPGIHGFDIARQLKANPRFARIPIILMTAVYRGWRYAHDARETLGVDDYIEKPFKLDDLVRRVSHHLEKSIGEPARNREKAEAAFAEGTRRLEAGDAAGAVAALDEGVEADPFDARLAFQLARALQAAGEVYKAIAAYERTADLRPDHFPALRALAALYQQTGFRRKAVEAWERAIPAAPDEGTKEKIKQNLLKLL